MKKFKVTVIIILILALLIGLFELINRDKGDKTNIEATHFVSAHETNKPKLIVKYTSLNIPNINSSFKSWMSHKAVTNKQSPQYKFINKYGWVDAEGFMRASCEPDLGVRQDYYMIALGSYYGTTIGTKYKITLDTGRVFYGVLSECKSDIHTNSTNQYVTHNKNIIEFLVDETKLNSLVKNMGSANVYMPLNGSVSKIEKMDFILK